jgi:cyclase
MPASTFRMSAQALVLAGLAATASAADTDPGFTVSPLAGSVSLIRGYECNIAASAGDDGIVVVDTCGSEVADQLIASAKRLSDKPIRFVINTHAHGDHSGGDAAFQKLAPVIAHENVRKRMAAGNEVTGDKPASPEALPIITFDGEVTFHLNGEEIRLLKLPPGHTDGDVAVEAAVRNGETLEQLTAKRPFDQWRASVPVWASSDKSLDGGVRNFYREIAPPK